MSQKTNAAPAVPTNTEPERGELSGATAKPIPPKHENEPAGQVPQAPAPGARAATADEVEVARTNPDAAQVKHADK